MEGKNAVATEVKQLLQRESQRRDARLIRRLNGRPRSGGISFVIAPVGNNGEWIEVSDKEGIERALLDENQRRFYQASGTSFMTTSPLYDAVGPLGISKGAQEILAGTFVIPEGTDPYAAKLIKHSKAPARVLQSAPLSVHISTDDHVKGWQRAKERTPSGPEGLHFGLLLPGLEIHGSVNLKPP